MLEIPIELPDALPPGTKAGPWIVQHELGRGGMGAVYAVVHEDIGKRAALKLVHRRLVHGSSSERIVLEAKVVNQIGHPNIVDVFETGELADGRSYIVMERLEGVPLSVRADEGKILPDAVIAILLQVCDALIAAHATGVVHRDLKVDNIFLTDEGVKVLDWGIAKVISADPHHTVEGQLVGTPQYLAPEQARGGVVSPATDVYSLGVVAYELFLEQLPFEAETSAEIMAMHLRQPPPPPRELWPDIPPTLERLVLSMLAKDADARPTMLEVARALEKVRDELEQRRRASANDRSGIVRGTPATPVPEEQRPIAWSSAPGLAPTEPAAPRTRPRRWQLAVGGLAVAISAVMILVTRDADSDAAVAPPSPSIVPPAVEVTAVAGPSAVAASEAPAPPLKIAPSAAAPVRATPASVPSTASRRHAAKPRRDLAHDPDGTIDPYR